MGSYKKMIPGVMIFLGLVFLLLYIVNPLSKNIDNKGQLVVLFALVAIASFWNKTLYYTLWMLMMVGLIVYYLIL